VNMNDSAWFQSRHDFKEEYHHIGVWKWVQDTIKEKDVSGRELVKNR
jgi:hypothetical protein